MNDDTAEGQPQGNRRFSMRWIIIGGAGLVVAVAVAVVAVHRLTTPSLVPVEKLDTALLDTERINAIMGAYDLQVGEPERAPAKTTFALSRPDCLGALAAAQAPTYADSGYRELRWSGTTVLGDKVDHYAAQAAAIFPDADKAGAFVQNSAEHWNACAGQTVVVMQADKSVVQWKLDAVVGDPPNIAISENRQDVDWTCQRALRAVANAVVDATACGPSITDQGRSIADEIAARIAK